MSSYTKHFRIGYVMIIIVFILSLWKIQNSEMLHKWTHTLKGRQSEKTFKKVPGINFWMYDYEVVYSRDITGTVGVVIIGLKYTDIVTNDVKCQLFYKDGVTEYVKGHVNGTIHSRKFTYQTSFCWCYPTRGQPAKSVTLSHINNKTQGISQRINPQTYYQVNGDTYTNSSNKIALCLQHMSFMQSSRSFLELMEIHKLLGVQKVILHGYDKVTKEVIDLIKYYQRKGYLEVLPWSIGDWKSGGLVGPEEKEKPDIYAYGLHLVRNDCLHRYYNQFEFMLFSDLDEIIMPKSSKIPGYYTGLLKYINNGIDMSTSVCQYLFKWTAFCVNGETVQKRKETSLFTGEYFIRSLPAKGNKVIVRVDNAYSMSTHSTSGCRQPRGVHVDPRIATVHHYRYRPTITQLGGGIYCNIEDKSAQRYQKRLKENMERVLEEINKIRL